MSVYRHNLASVDRFSHTGSFDIKNVKIGALAYLLGIVWIYKIGSISYYLHGFGLVWYLVGALGIAFALLVYLRGEVKVSWLHVAVALLCLSLIVISIVNGASLAVWLDEVFDILIFAITIDMGLNVGKSKFIKLGTYISLTLVTANTLSAVVFPNAMFLDASGAPTIFLMGADNSMIVRYMFAILFELFYKWSEESPKFPVIGVLNLAAFSYLRDIATGKVMALVLVVMLLAVWMNKGLRITPTVAVLINLVFFAVVVVGQSALGWANPIFQMLGRNSDFTHRAQLWDFSIDLINKHVLTGIGCFSDDQFNHLILTLTNTGLYNTGNPHNTYLTIMLCGGLISFGLFACILFIVCREAHRCISSRLVSVSALFMLAFMLHAQVEGRDTACIIAMGVWICSLRSYLEFQSMPSLTSNDSADIDSSASRVKKYAVRGSQNGRI